MLNFVLSVLVASSTTSALTTSYRSFERIWEVDQAPLAEDAASWIPTAPFREEEPSGITPSDASLIPAAPFQAEEPSEVILSDDSDVMSLVYQFHSNITLENIAVRADGGLVLTATNRSGVSYTKAPKGCPPKLSDGDFGSIEIPNVSGTLGVAEVAENFFIVAAGNYSLETFTGVEGSFSVWSLNFTNISNPQKELITEIPEAQALNGLTTVEGLSDVVLIADSRLGAIWRLNLTTKETTLMPHVYFNNTELSALGVNGIGTYEQNLYFVNTAQKLYGRVAIDTFGFLIAEPEILGRHGNEFFAWDDFVTDWAGNAWIATHGFSLTQIKLTAGGSRQSFTVNGMNQPTATAWGRGSRAASKILYVVTAAEQLPNGGQIYALNTSLL